VHGTLLGDRIYRRAATLRYNVVLTTLEVNRARSYTGSKVVATT
jgi:hypothetical protein